jgi:hypothetical protein
VGTLQALPAGMPPVGPMGRLKGAYTTDFREQLRASEVLENRIDQLSLDPPR